ncbi:MAG: PHP domain-containing protein [Gemmatimonadales bacterium]
MRLSPVPRPLVAAALLTAFLAISRIVGLPPISDPTGTSLPPGVHLQIPALYFVLGPLFTLWDGVSMLSMTRLKWLPAGLAILYAGWRLAVLAWPRPGPVKPNYLREVLLAAGSVLAFTLFVVVGALWHRPMLALAGTGPDLMAVDFHSHTNASHDVTGTLMAGFDAEANRRWHARAGFDAVFITDHNTLAGFQAARKGPGELRPYLCPGIEVSAYQAHIVLLGDTMEVDHALYDRSLDGLLTLLNESRPRYGSLAIASIPEYERNHWANLERFVEAGVAGFEVVNAAPRANQISRTRRNFVMALAHTENRLILGVNDSHGWGATSMAWSLVNVPGWRNSADPCALLLDRLRDGDYSTVHILERPRVRRDSWWPGWLTPVGVVGETWRSMAWPLIASWLGWIWGAVLVLAWRAKTRTGPAPQLP